jgi:DNA-binding transcriptional regulator of glucitol operon
MAVLVDQEQELTWSVWTNGVTASIRPQRQETCPAGDGHGPAALNKVGGRLHSVSHPFIGVFFACTAMGWDSWQMNAIRTP